MIGKRLRGQHSQKPVCTRGDNYRPRCKGLLRNIPDPGSFDTPIGHYCRSALERRNRCSVRTRHNFRGDTLEKELHKRNRHHPLNRSESRRSRIGRFRRLCRWRRRRSTNRPCCIPCRRDNPRPCSSDIATGPSCRSVSAPRNRSSGHNRHTNRHDKQMSSLST